MSEHFSTREIVKAINFFCNSTEKQVWHTDRKKLTKTNMFVESIFFSTAQSALE